ncbi:GNAT family N-acetyltransferase [Sphingomonas baiyangensis]|uniref:GNAT family N-acetyltransferase n=2 Tax=Sphingomonas baiyangensis TaxID=2572576 RepID=A0A4U1L6W2_9SPHN|nr:GNAT family N-acetyltransferase [Sphingomonas baiyangensis]
MIRPVSAADRNMAIASLAAAFADDPAMCFLFPDARQRRRHLPRLFAMLYDSDADRGLRLISDDRQAVTLWRAPGSADNDARFGWRQRLVALWRFGEGLERAHRLGKAIEAHFPPQPFWYLHIAGCAPAAQGRGLGVAAVRAGLQRIEGAPAYLETANEANLGFYRHLGFEVHSRWQVPGDGPVFWSMQRG